MMRLGIILHRDDWQLLGAVDQAKVDAEFEGRIKFAGDKGKATIVHDPGGCIWTD